MHPAAIDVVRLRRRDEAVRGGTPEDGDLTGAHVQGAPSEEVVELPADHEVDLEVVVPVRALHLRGRAAADPDGGVLHVDVVLGGVVLGGVAPCDVVLRGGFEKPSLAHALTLRPI